MWPQQNYNQNNFNPDWATLAQQWMIQQNAQFNPPSNQPFYNDFANSVSGVDENYNQYNYQNKNENPNWREAHQNRFIPPRPLKTYFPETLEMPPAPETLNYDSQLNFGLETQFASNYVAPPPVSLGGSNNNVFSQYSQNYVQPSFDSFSYQDPSQMYQGGFSHFNSQMDPMRQPNIVLPFMPNTVNDHEAQMMYAKKKALPAWLREGLEKMEKEKSKKEDDPNICHSKIAVGKSDYMQENILFKTDHLKHHTNSPDHIIAKGPLIYDRESSLNREDSKSECQSDLGTPKTILSEDNNKSDMDSPPIQDSSLNMVTRIKHLLTEILMLSTQELIADVVNDRMTIIHKQIDDQNQRKSQKALQKISVLGIGNYGTPSESEEESQDEENTMIRPDNPAPHLKTSPKPDVRIDSKRGASTENLVTRLSIDQKIPASFPPLSGVDDNRAVNVTEKEVSRYSSSKVTPNSIEPVLSEMTAAPIKLSRLDVATDLDASSDVDRSPPQQSDQEDDDVYNIALPPEIITLVEEKASSRPHKPPLLLPHESNNRSHEEATSAVTLEIKHKPQLEKVKAPAFAAMSLMNELVKTTETLKKHSTSHNRVHESGPKRISAERHKKSASKGNPDKKESSHRHSHASSKHQPDKKSQVEKTLKDGRKHSDSSVKEHGTKNEKKQSSRSSIPKHGHGDKRKRDEERKNEHKHHKELVDKHAVSLTKSSKEGLKKSKGHMSEKTKKSQGIAPKNDSNMNNPIIKSEEDRKLNIGTFHTSVMESKSKHSSLGVVKNRDKTIKKEILSSTTSKNSLNSSKSDKKKKRHRDRSNSQKHSKKSKKDGTHSSRHLKKSKRPRSSSSSSTNSTTTSKSSN